MDTSDHEQQQAMNVDNVFSVSSNDSSASVHNMISSLTFSKSVTSAMLGYASPWITQESSGEYRRFRTRYTSHELRELEKEFQINKYLTRRLRSEIAHRLALTERQIRIWFEERRHKWNHERFKSGNNLHVQPEINARNHDQNHQSSAISTNYTSA